MGRPKKMPDPSPTTRRTNADREAMPLSHATAIALTDLAAHHGLSKTAAAEYAIGLWHWITRQQQTGFTLCMANPDGDIHPVELPAPKATP